MKFLVVTQLLAAGAIAAGTSNNKPLGQELRLLETSRENIEIIFNDSKALKLSPNTMQLLGDNLVLIPKNKVEGIAALLHKKWGHCGGFIDITDEVMSPDAYVPLSELAPLPELTSARRGIMRGVEDIQPENIERFVKAYSEKFKTRVASSEEGQRAPEWLADVWKKMAEKAERSDIRVELVAPPKGYNQSSVRITIPGSSPELPIVVLGAHLDSISNSGRGLAPGADDDASGIAALTEAYRVILAHNNKPRATIEMFGYAAEELGLLGSRAIAESYRSKEIKVRGALQLDMTAFPSNTKSVTFMTDFTNKELTVWTEQIYGLYVGNEFKEDRCGYGCSDHASWHRYGFPSVMPFESPMNEMNRRIHTPKDIWDSALNAEYAANFAKLAYAFAGELSTPKQPNSIGNEGTW